MSLPLYQVDAFADALFAGNPAAVVPLEEWLPEKQLQQIAAENNLAETAYFVRRDDGGYDLRWFTPTCEVELCGHATLASAWVLFHCLDYNDAGISFHTRSGELRVQRDDEVLTLDLPRYDPEPCPAPDIAAQALGVEAEEWCTGPNYLARVSDAETLRQLSPDMALLSTLPERCLIVTAESDMAGVNFVSRFFAPNFGIPEDPVTGSAHCMLTPYWAQRLNKTSLTARQISARGGELQCELLSDRVAIGGRAVLYLRGEILL